MKKVDLILFPSSFFSISKVDENLQQEYDAVVETGFFDIVLFGYDKWFNEEKLILKNAPEKMRMAIYRGWMMKPEKYRKFYNLLIENNIELVTSPVQYEEMHIFPNVYPSVKQDTVDMSLFPLHDRIDVEEIKLAYDRFIVKDFVKSVKGTEFPKYFDRSITQTEFDQWMEIFYKYRGELLTGGICIKQYVDLKQYGNSTNEFRVFYINHVPATICRNSGQGIYTPDPPFALIEKYGNLKSEYYTVDYAELEDGSWKIIEAGDGQVSGLSENQDYVHYFRALYQCFK